MTTRTKRIRAIVVLCSVACLMACDDDSGSESTDTAIADTAITDTRVADMAIENDTATGPDASDTGAADTGVSTPDIAADTGSADTGADSGPADTGADTSTPDLAADMGAEMTVSDMMMMTTGPLVLNEFVVSPTAQEAVELYNPGQSPVSLDGWILNHSNATTARQYPLLAGLSVPAGGFTVITASELDTSESSILFNSGGVIELEDPANNVVDSVGYGLEGDAPTPIFSYSTGRVADGVSTGSDANDWNMDPGPTLGDANSVTAVDLGNTDLVINEFFVHEALAEVDFVELYNGGSSAIDIGGWQLIFGGDEHIVPNGTMLMPGAYHVIMELDFPDFSVLGTNGNLYLFDDSFVRVHQVTFGAPVDGEIAVDGMRSLGFTPDGNVSAFFGVAHATQGLEPMLPSPGMANGAAMP